MKIQEQINNLIGKIEDRHRYWVFAGVLVFVFILDYLIIMGPQLRSLSKIIPEIQAFSDELKVTNDNIQKVGSYRDQAKKLTAEIDQVSARMKSKKEFQIVLETLSRVADAQGIKIEEITPNSADQQEVLSTKGRKYFAVPISITARAGYHSFGKFLNELEFGNVMVNVDGFSIVATSDRRNHMIELKMKAVVYEE